MLCFVAAIALSLMGCSGPMPTATPTLPLPTLAPTLTQTPTRVLTELEAIDAEMRADFGTVHPNCGTDAPRPLQPGESVNCTQYLWTKPITRTEWSKLFPKSHFFLVGARRIQNYETNRNGYYQDSFVFAQQDGQRYNTDAFEQFLKANNVVTADANRELVAKAFVLMHLANYLEEDIGFSDWGKADWPARFGQRYNYALKGWTKIEGNKFQWLFLFRDGVLMQARGFVMEQSIGDYINVSPGTIRWPTDDYLRRAP